MHEQTERQCIPSKGLFTKESLEDQAHSFYCIVFAGVRGNKKQAVVGWMLSLNCHGIFIHDHGALL